MDDLSMYLIYPDIISRLHLTDTLINPNYLGLCQILAFSLTLTFSICPAPLPHLSVIFDICNCLLFRLTFRSNAV